MIAPVIPSKDDHAAVVNGELVYTSVSQMQLFASCPSRWYFKYVLRLPDDPPTRGQERGKVGHGRIEKYLGEGIDALDRLERLGLKYMPTPNILPGGTPHPVPVLVEASFDGLLKAEGVPMRGFVDLVNPRGLEMGVLEITDWKFKKSIEQYATHDEELIDPKSEAGIQMLGYAAWGALRFPSARSLVLRHVTFQTEGVPDVKPTIKPIQVDSAIALWETVTHSLIPRMKQAARAASHLEVLKNEKVCHKYRKACPYIGTCLDRMARVRAGFRSKSPAPEVLTEEKLMGMLQQMTGAAPQKTEPQKTEPIQIDSASQRKLSIIDVPSLPAGSIKAQDARQNADYLVQGVPCRFLCNTAIGKSRYASFMPTAGGPPKLVAVDEPVSPLVPPVMQVTNVQNALPLVSPPDAPKSDPALASKPLAPAPSPAPAAAEAVASASAQPSAPTAEEPKKRGRKPKAETADATPAPQPEQLPSMAGVHLYFGCTPVGAPTALLGSYVDALEQKFKTECQLNIADLRTAQDSTFGFGKWKGFFSKYAQENPPPPGRYIVTGADERIACVGDALAQIAEPGSVTIGGRS